MKTTPIPVKFDRQGHSCNFYAGFGPTEIYRAGRAGPRGPGDVCQASSAPSSRILRVHLGCRRWARAKIHQYCFGLAKVVFCGLRSATQARAAQSATWGAQGEFRWPRVAMVAACASECPSATQRGCPRAADGWVGGVDSVRVDSVRVGAAHNRNRQTAHKNRRPSLQHDGPPLFRSALVCSPVAMLGLFRGDLCSERLFVLQNANLQACGRTHPCGRGNSATSDA